MSDWPTNPDATVTAKQVAALYAITSIKTLKKYIAEGRIPQPESHDRMTWRAGDVVEYRKAWNLVQTVMRQKDTIIGQKDTIMRQNDAGAEKDSGKSKRSS